MLQTQHEFQVSYLIFSKVKTKKPVGHVYPRRALPPVFNEHKICSFDSGDGRMDEFHADSYIP